MKKELALIRKRLARNNLLFEAGVFPNGRQGAPCLLVMSRTSLTPLASNAVQIGICRMQIGQDRRNDVAMLKHIGSLVFRVLT